MNMGSSTACIIIALYVCYTITVLESGPLIAREMIKRSMLLSSPCSCVTETAACLSASFMLHIVWHIRIGCLCNIRNR